MRYNAPVSSSPTPSSVTPPDGIEVDLDDDPQQQTDASLFVEAPPRTQKRIVAVGGGKGGVGKSILALNLAVYFAQLGRSVVVIDADTAGANLHTVLGLDAPPLPLSEQLEHQVLPTVETAVPGLRLMGWLGDAGTLMALRSRRRFQWAAVLDQLNCDFVVLDLGAGTAPVTLDLFLLANIGLCVTVPEPPAIEATYRFLRALFLRRLRRALNKERFKRRVLERALTELTPLSTPLDLIQLLTRYDLSLSHLASLELGRMDPRLVVNETRVRTDVDLGPAMQAIAERFLGVDLDYIGHVEHDDAVWLTVRRRQPLLIDSPTSKSARSMERIARRVVALTAARETHASLSPAAPERHWTLYDVLGLSRGASDEEVRRAYKRQRELFSVGSLPLTSILGAESLRAEQARVEEAHDTLLDPLRRRAYDLSAFPDTDMPKSKPPNAKRHGISAEQLLLQAEVAREIHSITEYTGAFLRKVRESQEVEIAEIAETTKIAKAHLEAIEEENFTQLPAIVYTRGFVRQLAKLLKLDPAQVDRTYLRRMRAGFAALGRPVE